MTSERKRHRSMNNRIDRTFAARGAKPRPGEVDLGPASIYEAVTRTMVESLAEDVREIRNRITGLFWLLAGTVVAEIVMKALGVGS